MQNNNNTMGFIASTFSFLMVFAASATPIPLYDLYRREEHLTYNDLALTAVAYFIGAITALLIFGRISNHLGRKPVAFFIFGLTAVATIILLDVNSATSLIVGRLLLGLASGLASSSITSYIADSGTHLPQWIPAAIIGNSPMVGLTIGAIMSGLMVDFEPYPRMLCYLIILMLLAISTFLIVLSKETVEKKPGFIASLKPRFSLPLANKKLFPIAAATFVATWALGGFYQAFSPSIGVDQLGTHSTFMIGVLFSSYLLPCAIGGPLTTKFTPANAQRIGMTIFTLGLMGVIFSLKTSNIVIFLLSSVLAGMAQGIALTGSLRALLANIQPEERAGLFSLIYAISYLAAAILSFIAGRLSHHMNIFHISLFYGALATLACFITLAFARNPSMLSVGGER